MFRLWVQPSFIRKLCQSHFPLGMCCSPPNNIQCHCLESTEIYLHIPVCLHDMVHNMYGQHHLYSVYQHAGACLWSQPCGQLCLMLIVFISLSRPILGYYLKCGHYNFLPHSIQCVIQNNATIQYVEPVQFKVCHFRSGSWQLSLFRNWSCLFSSDDIFELHFRVSFIWNLRNLCCSC
jgi:hypothetical protein